MRPGYLEPWWSPVTACGHASSPGKVEVCFSACACLCVFVPVCVCACLCVCLWGWVGVAASPFAESHPFS